MRFFFSFFVLACSLSASAQTHFGLKFAPTLCLNKATGSYDKNSLLNTGISRNDAGIRYNFGIWSETNFSKSESSNVAFYTGVFYANKRIGYSLPAYFPSRTIDAVTDLQYFQVPIALKFISDEIFDKARIYVLLGVANDFTVSEHTKTNEKSAETSSNFHIYDINFLVGAGLEYKISTNNSLVFGISHTRGLTNLYKNDDNSNIELKSRIFALDLGVKF